MKYLGQLVLACLVSVALYFVLFGYLVSRPLSVDVNGTLLNAKLAYAAQARSPKMVIIAGSNARFSHSCAIFEQLLKRDCVNLGMSADVGLDWVFDNAEAYLKPGDFVYLPIEYSFYRKTRTEEFTGSDAAYRFRHDKSGLATRGPEGLLRAAFLFDLSTLVQSIGEMGLNAAGVHRRAAVAAINAQGDAIHHGDFEARPFEAIVAAWKYEPFGETGLSAMMDNPDGAQAILGNFLDWCREHHVTAVAGLPTVFNDEPLPDAAIATLRRYYARHGTPLVVLPNRSQYPRKDFFDTADHLREREQAMHSVLLAAVLRPLLPPAPHPAKN